MKKWFLILVGVSVLLVGCHHQMANTDSSTKTLTSETVQNKLNYFQYLVDKYQTAVEYSKTHEHAQAPLAALTVAYDELKQDYATDIQVIDKSYSDLQIVLKWNSDAWQSTLAKWADGLNQHYEQIHHNDFDKQNSLIPLLKNTTVNHKKVSWNIFGVSDTTDYDYLIVDAYQDIQNKHLYLFTIQSGQPVVLYSNSTVEQLANSNVESTQNQELTKAFHVFVLLTSTKTESKIDVSEKIADIMKIYTSKGEHYHIASPATQRQYYGLSVPDEVFQYAKVNGKSVTLKWNSWIVGEGDETYSIQACYVNDSGTEVVLFAYHNGKPIVLHTVVEPKIQKSKAGTTETVAIHFEELTNSELKSVFE